jgi:6,7-dimethyl-8-ribityllumazine synthase
MKPILLVVSPYYQELTDTMIEGATRAIEAVGFDTQIITVPGAFEIPGAIAMAHTTGAFSGYVALGCVIRGDTSHYDYVCNESARGLQQLALEQHAAIGYGILTVENMEQALLRADLNQGDKGGEAARACLRMMELRQFFGLETA